MTALTIGPAKSIDTPWDAHRRELASLLDHDPEALPDHAHLIEDLALDSLTMMRIIVWLEHHGVVLDADRSGLARVGDVLSLLDAAATPDLTIRIAERDEAGPVGATEIPALPPPAADPLAPVLENNGLRLDPVGPDDIGFLYALAVAPETGFRWRYRGAPPPFEQFTEDVWRQVLVQYVARRSRDGEPVGQVVAYGADPGLCFVYVGAVFVPPHTGTGLAAQAVALFVRYLFHTFPLTKAYLEVPGYNWAQVRSGEGTLFEVEGVLRDHHFYAGRRWDQYLCAIYRDRLPQGIA